MGRMEPIAKRLKQSAESALVASAKKASKQEEEDIAERIRRLEAELESSSSGSDSDSDADSSDDDDNDESSHDLDSDGSAKKKSKSAKAVLSLSKYATERIEALPEALLPAKRTAFPMKAEKKSKKRKLGDSAQASGMTAAHQALLELVHVPKKVPFACKRCAFVGKDMADFDAHRQSPEHLAKAQEELRCVLCDKAFTSAAQLEEHRKGKWHLQRAQQKKERHVVRVCYDFLRGTCTFGDRCNFAHAESRAMRSGKALERKKQRVCEQFAKSGGRACKFGDQCLFSHDRA